jgi:hypothetical protein
MAKKSPTAEDHDEEAEQPIRVRRITSGNRYCAIDYTEPDFVIQSDAAESG